MSQGRRRTWLGVAVFAAAIAVAATPASASVTIGRTAINANSCDQTLDIMQPNLSDGTSYTAPGQGTITSWSYNASGMAGQLLTLKMFRKVGDPLRYQVVGHSDSPPTTAGFNTFPANIDVMPGDLLGLHTTTDNTRCAYDFPGAPVYYLSNTNLADGASADFQFTSESVALNVEATFVPDNTFNGKPKVKRNKNGTATVTLNLPNPGTLSASGSGAKISKAKTYPAGKVKLKVKAKGLKKRQLEQKGKVKLTLSVIYTPTGGDPHQQKIKLKLAKG